MSALAQSVYNFVADNPGEKSAEIVQGLALKVKPKSVQAYLSLLKKAKLLKVMPSNPDGSGASTYYVHRKWNAKLLAEVMPKAGIKRFGPRSSRPLNVPKSTRLTPAKPTARTDHRINKHGVNVLNLEVGHWVEIEWNDAPNESVLILSLEHRLDSYKGERTIGTLHKDADGWYTRMASAGSSQVVRVLGTLSMPRFARLAD